MDKVCIIGAGPAGISTAIQIKRYGIEPLVFEKGQIGGLLRNANLVENYPGFPRGISGSELVKLLKKQLENSGIKVYFEEVLKLDYKNKKFYLRTTKRKLTSNFVVIASGTKPKKIPNIVIPRNLEKYVFYEVYPLKNIKNKRIVIVGAGDCAFDYALSLSKKNKVLILNRDSKPKCLPLLLERAYGIKNIFYYEGIEVKEIKLFNNKLCIITSGISVLREIYAHYFVIAIGREPALDFLSDNIKNNFTARSIINDCLFLAGDVKNGLYRQVSIATGDGVKTAMKIYKKICV